jgi:hypothetical protein
MEVVASALPDKNHGRVVRPLPSPVILQFGAQSRFFRNGYPSTMVMTEPDEQARWRSRLFLLGLLFVLGRVLLVLGPHKNSDVWIYADYVREQELASQAGVSVEVWHAREVEAASRRLESQFGYRPSLEEFHHIEYPPLALQAARLPLLWMSHRESIPLDKEQFRAAYTTAYQWGMAFVDVVLCLLVVLLVRRFFPLEAIADRTERLLAYILATLALWPMLYDRLDLVVGLLVAVALSCLASRVPWLFSFAALAVAINYKLVPVILTPIWLVGSLPVAAARWSRVRTFGALVVRGVVLMLLTIACFVPFFWRSGWESLGFFHYHETRGIEINTLYSSLLLALRGFGQNVEIYSSHTSINVRSALSPLLVNSSPFIVGGLLIAATILFLRHVRRLLRMFAARGVAQDRLAEVEPALFASYSLLFLLIFIAANKVLSPQYLLMTVPLVPLVSLTGRGRRWFLWSFVAMCLITTLHFPFLFQDLHWSSGGSFGQPAFRWIALLDLRNLLLLGITAGLGVALIRQARRCEPAGPALTAAEDSISHEKNSENARRAIGFQH